MKFFTKKFFANYDFSESVVFDNSGNLAVTGWFLSPNAGFGSIVLVNQGGYDVFVAI
ncbi:MAG: hypothetical protein H0X46_07145 [Bacteroidetes bacterium]|nr:hypothetical protein [Bacteroidota bacterium]